MPRRNTLHDELVIAVQLATERLKRAERNFAEYIDDIPSGLPAPDGQQRIRNAADERKIALASLHRAIERLNAFVLVGKIPDDL